MSRIKELEARLNVLTSELLAPLRATKEVNTAALNGLLEVVDGLVEEIGKDAHVPRLLTGKLWFIFTQMLSEADHTRSPDDILNSAWLYESRLEHIFGPTFAPPDSWKPGIPRMYR